MYTLQTSAQLSAHLKSLRKSRGLTQAQLGARLGVSAARIGAIEHDPGTVGLAQLLRVLHSLGARVYIDAATAVSESTPSTSAHVGEW